MEEEKRNQIERIQYMEQILDEALEAVKELSDALEKYCVLKTRIAELADYYDGPDWRKDFEDDCEGKIPRNLKRGVLSEDAVYNLLTDNQCLLQCLKEASAKYPVRDLPDESDI